MRRCAFLLGAVLAGPTATVAQTGAPLSVHVGGTPNDDMTPVVYAQRTGMFARGSAVAAAVVGGSYAIGKSVLSAFLDAHEKGIPFRIIAPCSIEDVKHPYGGMLFLRDVKIASGKDLEGQTIGLSDLGSVARVAIPAWMEQHGGDGSTLKFMEVPGTAVAAALEQHRIFAGEANYPMLGAALATGRFNFIPVYGAIASRFVGSVFYTTAAYSNAHPDVIRTFARVYYAAARYTNVHHDATAQMMSEFTGVPVEVIGSRPRVASATELDLAQIQPTIDLYAKYGLLKRDYPARELVDPNTLR